MRGTCSPQPQRPLLEMGEHQTHGLLIRLKICDMMGHLARCRVVDGSQLWVGHGKRVLGIGPCDFRLLNFEFG